MSLEKLFESLDEKVFTTELKEALSAQFNEAVELKAQLKADELAEAKIDELQELSEQHIAKLQEEQTLAIETAQAEMVEHVSKYLDRIVEEFTADAKQSLEESAKSEKADMIIEAFETMLVAGGVRISKIVEAKDESSAKSKLEESVSKYDALVQEVIALNEENEKLLSVGVINELCADLTLVESEKFKKLAALVDFSKDAKYVEKLETILENVKGSSKVSDINESTKNDGKAPVKAPAWAHLV